MAERLTAARLNDIRRYAQGCYAASHNTPIRGVLPRDLMLVSEECEELRAQVAALTQERDAWKNKNECLAGDLVNARKGSSDLAAAAQESLAREQALREALEGIIDMTIKAASYSEGVSGYRIKQLADAALQPPDAPTET